MAGPHTSVPSKPGKRASTRPGPSEPGAGAPSPHPAEDDLKTGGKTFSQLLSLLRATLESTADGILVVDGSGKVVDFNQVFAQLWRIPTDLLASRDDNLLLQYVRDQLKDPDAFLAKVRRLYGKPNEDSFDVLEFKDGRVFERYSRPQLVAGRPVGRVWSFRDVTRQKQTEQSLRETAHTLQTIFNAARDGILVTDAETKHFIFANPEICRLTGYSEAELLKMGVPDLHSAKDQPFHLEQFTRLAKGEIAATTNVSVLRKDGGQVWCDVSCSLTEIAGRKMVIGSFRDITERKRSEEEKSRLEAQILQSQKLESLGLLAGGIAHDFNNMLMVILGSADLAHQDVPDGSAAQSRIEGMIHVAKRAADLCNQLLAYAGKGQFVIKPVNLSELVQDMTHMLEVAVSMKATLRMDLARDIPAIEADASQVRQILMNLTINASEAIGERGGTITIATGRVHCSRHDTQDTNLHGSICEGPYVSLSVTDTGCGMDSSTMRKIFDPFFSTKFTGRGLGLSAVLGIMRSHKGAIRIRSEPGRGTTFTALFPASALPAESTVMQVAPESGGRRERGLILLVDDETTVLDVCGQMLENIGFEVVCASSGPQAVELFGRHRDKIRCVVERFSNNIAMT